MGENRGMNDPRRRFLLGSARLAAWYGVLFLGASRSAWGRGLSLTAAQWSQELESLALEVKAGRRSGEAWQSAIEALHSRIPLEELVSALDVATIVKGIKHPTDKLGAVHDVALPGAGPGASHFGHKLFVYRKGACTPPHAHNHLVSAHLVLQGNIRVRTFDRVQDLEDSLLLDPRTDRVVGPGQTVSMSDGRDNVHWFEGVSELSVSFDVPVADIDPEKNYRHPAEGMNQLFVDPTGPKRGDGYVDAPLIRFREAVRRFAS